MCEDAVIGLAADLVALASFVEELSKHDLSLDEYISFTTGLSIDNTPKPELIAALVNSSETMTIQVAEFIAALLKDGNVQKFFSDVDKAAEFAIAKLAA